MNMRLNVAYSVIVVVFGYVVFFAVSGIPVLEYMSLALSLWLVQLGLNMSIHNPKLLLGLEIVASLATISAGYALWGWALLVGGLAMAAVGLTGSAVWGLMYWLSERRMQF